MGKKIETRNFALFWYRPNNQQANLIIRRFFDINTANQIIATYLAKSVVIVSSWICFRNPALCIIESNCQKKIRSFWQVCLIFQAGSLTYTVININDEHIWISITKGRKINYKNSMIWCDTDNKNSSEAASKPCRSWIRRKLVTPAFRFRVDESGFEKGHFRKRYSGDNRVIFLI